MQFPHRRLDRPARILIVVDNKLASQDLSIRLNTAGYHVVGVVGSGEEATHMAQEQLPDLVIMSVRLSGVVDGIDAAWLIRDRLDTAIVLLTDDSEDAQLAGRAMATQPYGYLNQAVSWPELQCTLETALYRHRVERRLRESEKKYRTLVETAPDAIIEIDVLGNILVFNDAFLLVTGYTVEEMTGMSLLDLQPPEPENISFQDHLAFLAQEQPEPAPWIGQYRVSNGSIIDVHADCNYRRDHQGNVIGFIWIITDITATKKVQEALRVREEEYRLLVNRAREAIYVLQGERIRFVNRRAVQLAGYSEPELLSMRMAELIFPDDRERAVELFVSNLRGDDVLGRCSVRMVRSQGDPVWVDIDTTVAAWKGEPALLLFATDVTERKRAEEEQSRASGRLPYASTRALSLSGFLVICAACRKIRDGDDHWQEIEAYVRNHCNAQFSHTICPECSEKLYPDLDPFEPE